VSRTEDLESEIETLKKDIQIRDQTIKARDMDLALARKQEDISRARALESEKTLDRVLSNLTEANEAKAALTTRVAEVELEKDSLVADKQALSEKQKEAHARCKRLWRKSHHYKSKSKCFKKQLALVPWLRVLSWGRGSNWGFESLRTTLLHPEVFKVDPETVTPNLLGMPETATDEL
jgi:chromosome segregation ATPase